MLTTKISHSIGKILQSLICLVHFECRYDRILAPFLYNGDLEREIVGKLVIKDFLARNGSIKIQLRLGKAVSLEVKGKRTDSSIDCYFFGKISSRTILWEVLLIIDVWNEGFVLWECWRKAIHTFRHLLTEKPSNLPLIAMDEPQLTIKSCYT